MFSSKKINTHKTSKQQACRVFDKYSNTMQHPLASHILGGTRGISKEISRLGKIVKTFLLLPSSPPVAWESMPTLQERGGCGRQY